MADAWPVPASDRQQTKALVDGEEAQEIQLLANQRATLSQWASS